jgi:hypothetical protein
MLLLACFFSCKKEPENILEYQYLISNHAPFEVKVWMRSKTLTTPGRDTTIFIPSGGTKTIKKIIDHTQNTVENYETDNSRISILDSIAVFKPSNIRGRFNLLNTKRWKYLKINDQQAQYILTIYKQDF